MGAEDVGGPESTLLPPTTRTGVTRRALTGSAVTVSVGTMGSKLLGLVRDVVLGDRFASAATGPFIIAAQLPLTVFAAVLASITTVFIPTFAELRASGDEVGAERFAANINGVATATVALLVLLLELLAGPVVHAMTPSTWSAHDVGVTIAMVRIMAPLILFYAWSSVSGGVLNTHGWFGPNAAMGIPQNLVIIGSILIGSLWWGGIRMVALGSLVGTSLTFLIQVPALRRLRFHFRWRLDLRDPLLHRVAKLVGPAALVALAGQAAILVDRRLAAGLGVQIVKDLTFALRLQGFAYGVLGYSVATVLYPRLAEAAVDADPRRMRMVISQGIGMVNFVTLPTMLGLFVLRRAALHAIFQHGAFSAQDTADAAWALSFFALGTLSYAWSDYLSKSFFALRDTRTPMLANLSGVVVTVILDLLLVGPMKQGGLALGTASGWSCAALFLALRLHRKTGALDLRWIIPRVLHMFAVALVAVLTAQAIFDVIAPWAHGSIAYAASLALAALCGAALYVGLAAVTGIPETAFLGVLFQAVWRRVGGNRS